jgi:DNA-binding CsgD family transcriptional regulator
MSTPPKKPTDRQQARRRQAVLRYREAGHSRQEIAAALSMTERTVQSDARTLIGENDAKSRRGHPDVGLGFVPESVNWWDEPVRDLPPLYRRSAVRAAWRNALEADKDTNGINAFAWDVIYAFKADDREWVADAKAEITAAIIRLQAHLESLESGAARLDAARDPRHRDDLARRRDQRRQDSS